MNETPVVPVDGGVAAKALRDAANSLRNEAATVWGGDTSWLTTGSKAASLAADWVSAIADNLTDSEDWK